MEVPAELRVFEDLQDLVVAFDETLTIRYVNSFARRLLHHEDTPLDQQNLLEFVHPDDLGRAAEIAGLIQDDRLLTDLTPANYRLRTRLGDWVDVELMGTPQFTDGALAGMIVIVGRYSGDNVIRDRILDMLTFGTPLDDIVPLIPEFGLWRHPEAEYAVMYTDGIGERRIVGSRGAIHMAERFDGPDTPWQRAEVSAAEVRQLRDELPQGLREAATELDLHACMVQPVRDALHDDHALAISWSARRDQDIGAHRYALERMAQSLDILLQWRAHTAALEKAATRDSLSGLANRATFFGHLGALLQSGNGAAPAASEKRGTDAADDACLAVFYVDLDHFKQVNDTNGHAFGDAVIVEAAARMNAAVRRSDVVARLGGDEFAIVCSGLSDVAEVVSMADRLVAALGAPFEHDGATALLGASIGVAVGRPGDVDGSAILAAADRALYDAKSSGRGRWSLASD